VRFELADPFATLLDRRVRAAALRPGITGSPTELRWVPETGNSIKALTGHRFGQGFE